jgi:hypothetical protein
MTVDDVLDRIKLPPKQAQEQTVVLPDGMTIPNIADAVIRGKVKLSPQQMRLLVELLPFYLPKLSAVAVGHFAGEDFAARLDRAVTRSMQVIDGKVFRNGQQVELIESDADQCPDH